jgi:hypothetical protein
MINGLLWSVFYTIYGMVFVLLMRWYNKAMIVKLKDYLGIFGLLLGWVFFVISMIVLFIVMIALFINFFIYFFDYYLPNP